MLDSKPLVTDRASSAYGSSGINGIMREVQSQTLPLAPRPDGSCRVENPCSPFKPDYSGNSDSARAWNKEAKQQKGKEIEVGPDGKYEVKQGDSLWGIAERSLKKEGGKASQAEVQKRVKELVEANKEQYPGLDCNPNLLKRGSKLIVPGQAEKPADKAEPKADTKADPKADTKVAPEVNRTNKADVPKVEVPAGKPSGPNQGDSSDGGTRVRPVEQVKPPVTGDLPTDKPITVKPPTDKLETDKPAIDGKGDVCKPGDIYRDLAKFPDLKTEEYLAACRISKAVIDGDVESLKRAMNGVSGKESGERIARALNENFKEQGVVFDFNEFKYRTASQPDRDQTSTSMRMYRRGADKYLEVSKDHVGLGGPVQVEPGGAINYGGVAYHSESMRQATIDDMSKAMKKRYC